MTRDARSAFLRGAARVLDLGGTLSRGPRSSFAADGLAIRSDWAMVGCDVGNAMEAARDTALRARLAADAQFEVERTRRQTGKQAAE